MRRFSLGAPAPQTWDQIRQRMLDDTSRYIEWGLQHPDLVKHIPMHPVGGRAVFSETLKSLFWSIALRDDN